MEVLFPCGDLLLTCRRNQLRPLVADSFCGSSICGSVDALKAGADITNASYPIVLSTDVVTKSTPKLTYGVETGLGFDFQTQQLLRMPFVDYLDNYPFEKNGLWTVIQRISPVPINYRTLREKYSNVQRKICK